MRQRQQCAQYLLTAKMLGGRRAPPILVGCAFEIAQGQSGDHVSRRLLRTTRVESAADRAGQMEEIESWVGTVNLRHQRVDIRPGQRRQCQHQRRDEFASLVRIGTGTAQLTDRLAEHGGLQCPSGDCAQYRRSRMSHRVCGHAPGRPQHATPAHRPHRHQAMMGALVGKTAAHKFVP
ncbi:hypothetical protein [Pandoraea norimbergensis]